MQLIPNINQTWLNLVNRLLTCGAEVKPREIMTRELCAFQTTIDMNQPVMSVKERKMGYRFMCAEAWWILSGDNRVSTISPYSKHIKNFSDNGITFAGAYGPRVVDQLAYIVDSLAKDEVSRQSVLTIWRPNPRDSKDIPCTVSIQWMIRDGKLHCFDYMRSSDAWLGWIYDVFNFSCVSMYIVLALRERGIHVELGGLTLTATSQHLYEYNFESAHSTTCKAESFDIKPVDLSKFDHPEDLVIYLKEIADFDDDTLITTHWLSELPHVQG